MSDPRSRRPRAPKRTAPPAAGGPRPDGFVPLASLKQGASDPAAALAAIRRLYFETTRHTIEHDFAHAIALLKTLPTEEAREKASVFMEGLTEMRREWEKAARRAATRPARDRGRRSR
jgi:hypothetical protein